MVVPPLRVVFACVPLYRGVSDIFDPFHLHIEHMFDTMLFMATTPADLKTAALAVAAGLEPDLMSGEAAARAVRDLAVAEKAVATARMFVALRVARTDAWRGQGHASAPDWLAAECGISVREAAGQLGTARKAKDLPNTKKAMDEGKLSPTQAGAVTDGASADPGVEDDLLSSAATDTTKNLKDKATKARAAATDSATRERRVRAERCVRTRTDSEGAFTLWLRGPAADGARLLAMLKPFEEHAFQAARTRRGETGVRDTFDNRNYDAFFDLIGHLQTLAGIAIGAAGASGRAAASGPVGTPDVARTSGSSDARGAGRIPGPGGSAGSGGASGISGGAGHGGTSDVKRSPASDAATSDLGAAPGTPAARTHGSGASSDPSASDPSASDPGAPSISGSARALGPAQRSGLARAADPAGDLDPSGSGSDGGDSAVVDTRPVDLGGRGSPAPPGNARSPRSSGSPLPGGSQPDGAGPGPAPGRIAPGHLDPLLATLSPKQVRALGRHLPGGNNTKVIINIDLAAYRRGHTRSGETCEITGLGPVPVAVAKSLMGDAFIAAVIRDGRHVHTVTHLGRGLSAHQRTALEAVGLRCSNIACNQTVAIQIDHRTPWAHHQVTELANQDPLCPRCHDLKTHHGHRLQPGTGPRPFCPPPIPMRAAAGASPGRSAGAGNDASTGFGAGNRNDRPAAAAAAGNGNGNGAP